LHTPHRVLAWCLIHLLYPNRSTFTPIWDKKESFIFCILDYTFKDNHVNSRQKGPFWWRSEQNLTQDTKKPTSYEVGTELEKSWVLVLVGIWVTLVLIFAIAVFVI